jgi:hypothetical protein
MIMIEYDESLIDVIFENIINGKFINPVILKFKIKNLTCIYINISPLGDY